MHHINRPQIGEAQRNKGHTITAHKLSPDLLMRRDGKDAGVYVDAAHGFRAQMAFIDQLKKEEQTL